VHDKDLPRIKWKLGKIEQVHKGQDNLTRSASLRTTSGLSNRAIGKLYPLELHVGIEEVAQQANEPEVKVRPRRAAADIARERIKKQLRD
jgi:hypothetical protein